MSLGSTLLFLPPFPFFFFPLAESITDNPNAEASSLFPDAFSQSSLE